MWALSDSDGKNGNVVTCSFSRVSLSYHLSGVDLLFVIRLLLQVWKKAMEHISFFYKKSLMHRDLPWIKPTLATRTKMLSLFLGWVHGWKCLWHWERDVTCKSSSMPQRMCHSHYWFLLTEGHKANLMEQKVQYRESESRVNLCMAADSGRASSYILMLLWVRKNLFSSSGLRRGFLGHVFNRKSQPFMCM